jgi:hypothetical protein
MSILPAPDAPLLVELPPEARLTEVLVAGGLPAEPPAAAPVQAVEPPVPPAPGATLAGPAEAAATTSDEPAGLPSPDAFPGRAALDAILAALVAPPPPPDEQARAEIVAILGLDPAVAADPALFDATLAALTDPDSMALRQQWLDEAGAVPPEPDPFPVMPDWLLG